MLKLDKISTEAVFVENYEIGLFRYDYMHILEYLCRVSFLTTLDIYKDYFKAHHEFVAIGVTCIGVVERKNRVIQEMARAMLHYKDVVKNLWGEVVIRLTGCISNPVPKRLPMSCGREESQM